MLRFGGYNTGIGRGGILGSAYSGIAWRSPSLYGCGIGVDGAQTNGGSGIRAGSSLPALTRRAWCARLHDAYCQSTMRPLASSDALNEPGDHRRREAVPLAHPLHANRLAGHRGRDECRMRGRVVLVSPGAA
ncbi:hypothetical protein WS67_01475 [Burkholderia singularis]|uniref:Uncharacterized protein n=1 Tax=Burkholderia singularis TaxID=1503053 RepID=A0A103DWZ5_9BURK|nr:hypothetical protein WS67_01475 [Burkholderia singularis]